MNFKKLERDGQDYSENCNDTVFVGRNFYQKLEGEVMNGKGEIVRRVKLLFPEQGCCSYVLWRNDTGEILGKTAFIQATSATLYGVCSELIPWTTLAKANQYATKNGLDNALKADEAIAEGLSNLVSLEAVREFRVPDGERILREMNVADPRTSERYSLVPQSISWLQKNGVQNGFDLYMDDPAKYVAAITAV